MLKKALMTPTQPWRAKTRLSPNFVLAALRGLTMELLEVRNYPLAFDRSERFKRSLVCTSSPLRLLRLRGTTFLNIQGQNHHTRELV
jgi:hypothetical protein